MFWLLYIYCQKGTLSEIYAVLVNRYHFVDLFDFFSRDIYRDRNQLISIIPACFIDELWSSRGPVCSCV